MRKINFIALGIIVLLALPFLSISQAHVDKEVSYPYYGFVEDPNHPWETVYDALDETDTISYSDEFFEVPSVGDHPELRALSYALALAGYENQADGYPMASGAQNPKLTNLLTQMGFSDFEYWDLKSEEDGHSMGTTIARKILPSGQDLVVVAPRNYNYMTEWLSNFNVGTSGDHAGFSESADLIVDRFNEYVTSRNLSSYKTWIVGYSRGGAVVDLVGKNININIDNYDMRPEDFYVYTFGAPRASITETGFTNIHDVKDGNDLLLGYVFPEIWGFYNTGVYEEIHEADLMIDTSVVNITELANPATAPNVLSNNTSLTEKVGTMNGRDFMDKWIGFVTDAGLTREYFDAEVKAPLSAIMKLYQSRSLDEQSEFTGFFGDINQGLAGMVAGNAFYDLTVNYNADLSAFPTYNYLVSVLRGTATTSEIESLTASMASYMGEYDDYEERFGQVPVTSDEFASIKDNLPKLIRALLPIIVADGKYTQENYGENASLYYTYSLAANAENLVYGHIPESIMPILKSMILEEKIVVPKAPDSGMVR